MVEYAIEAQGLTKEYDGVLAVRGLDLQVRKGEIFGLVGPDGAGKTSTMRMLTGVIPITSGTLRILGVDMLADPEPAKARIGYMSQQLSLYGDLTVMENLEFFADLYQVPLEERKARIPRLLEFSRLGPFTRRLAQNLSGGMKQKLALACTLIHTPEVLFLDEPTTGVDPVSRRDFWRILYDLNREGVTLFVSTPYMDEAERCERIALMHQGRILITSTPGEMRQKMEGSLLELQTHEERRARQILLGVPEFLGVEVFGDRVHITVFDPEAGMKRAAEVLDRAGVPYSNLHPIPPGLEDVFVSLIRRAEKDG